jgi:Asp-tRNA(Asn)/Glu-tRNA(Gln) amidotransferase A subunit family amidase
LAAGEPPGLLHGVPVSVKDHLEVKGVPCSYGQAEFRDFVPTYDAIAVERARAAGAVFVGKTNLPGLVRPGVVEHPCANPWDLARVPGGSSAGGAASVAAGMVPLALGSDGGGSIRVPASFCGVIGLHSSGRRAPGYNYKPEMYTSVWGSTVGPISRNVRDAALMLQVLAGRDWRDLTCLWNEPPDYLADLARGVAGLRMAWTPDFGFASTFGTAETPEVIETVRKAAFRLTELGPSVEEPEFAVPNPGPAAAQIRDALKEPRAEPALSAGGSREELIRQLRPQNEAFVKALHVRAEIGGRFDGVFESYSVLLSPMTRSIAPTLEGWNQADPAAGYHSHAALLNFLGLPALTLPCGFVGGMPVGLQLIGPPESEPTLFRVAHAFMEAYPQTVPPAVEPDAAVAG